MNDEWGMFAKVIADAESSWERAADNCSGDNVGKLATGMMDAFHEIMKGQPNADVMVALAHYLAMYTRFVSGETGMPLYTSMLMMHVGHESSLRAHVEVEEALAESHAHGLDS